MECLQVAIASAVTARAGVGLGSVGLLSSIPAGNNVVGGVTQSGTWTEANSSTIVTNTTSLATHTDASTINTTLGTLATQTTLAAAKSDLDTIATNTTSIATAANQTTGNTSLSTIATNTTNTQAASGAAMPANLLSLGMKAFGALLKPLQSAGLVGNINIDPDLLLASASYVYQGTGGGVQAGAMLRTPSSFKSATATASGNTAVWTPGSSKKFRLMRYRVEVTANAAQATGGVITLQFQDNTTALALSHSVFVPATAGATMSGSYISGWIDLGNGILSSTANNVLNINLSAALTSGTVAVIACGTEE